MQADALAQYEGLFATGTVIHAACNAHARRRFVEAQASAPAEAEEALKYIRKLYKVERELGEQFAADDAAGRQQYRFAQTAAVREEFHAWLLGQQPRALPKSPLGEAVGYALSNWSALMRYTDQGYLSIGRVERWRGSLGQAQLLPALSSAGASLARTCPVSTSRSSNRTCRFPASGSHPDPQAFAFGRAARRSGTGKSPRSSYR